MAKKLVKSVDDQMAAIFAAVAIAVKELPKVKTAAQAAAWFEKHYRKATYKHLARAYIAHFKPAPAVQAKKAAKPAAKKSAK